MFLVPLWRQYATSNKDNIEKQKEEEKFTLKNVPIIKDVIGEPPSDSGSGHARSTKVGVQSRTEALPGGLGTSHGSLGAHAASLHHHARHASHALQLTLTLLSLRPPASSLGVQTVPLCWPR